MRVLKIDEARLIFTKIVKFQGIFFINFIKKRISELYLFRILKNRIFYASIILISRANSFSKKNIGSLGICIGRFDKSGKFYFLIPALNFLIKCPKFNSIIINEIGEKNFIYGRHLRKNFLSKIIKYLNRNDGVIIMGKDNFPLGLGEILKDSSDFLRISDKEIVIINQGDIGKYIRANTRK
jgi:60S ribosome subunit biogenesis protein NIP7